MWFKLEDKRTAVGQAYTIRCFRDVAGQTITDEQTVKGVTAARKTAELLATSLNTAATVYARDAVGEFAYGVYDVTNDPAAASSPLVRRLYADATLATLDLKDRLLADIPEETIRGFATLAAALGYFVEQHKAVKRASRPQISYAALFRTLCGGGESTCVTLPANDATLALLGRRLSETPGWMWLEELGGLGSQDRQVIVQHHRPQPVTLNIDGTLQVIRFRTVFRGTVVGTGAHFLLIVQHGDQGGGYSLAVVFAEADEAAVIPLTEQVLRDANPFKNRVVLVNRDLRTVRSRISDRTWADIIPHEGARAELDFITSSIRDRKMLKAEGLSFRRGLLLSGPPGDGKSTAIECFVNGLAGEVTVIVVEAVDHIRAIYHMAQSLAPAVVVLEDLDLMSKNRQSTFAHHGKDDVTGELLQVLSGGSAYDEVVTIATTNHPEAIDEALSKRAGRFDAHVRLGYPDAAKKTAILDLYLDRFAVTDQLTRRRLQQEMERTLGKLLLVPAHIEELVKAGVKRARLARRTPEFADFEPGFEATRSIASVKASGS